VPEYSWSQDIFSKGELSPLMYARITVDAYYNGLKQAQNCITYPQGGIGKRFGTIYQNEVSGITTYDQSYFESFQYLNECIYIVIFIPDSVLIYLEGTLVATVSSTGIVASEIPLIDSTVIEANFRVSSKTFAPKDLIRSALTPNVIASVGATEITLTTPVTAGLVLPVEFTTSGALPTTSPQIRTNQTYFLYTTSTTTATIHSTAPEAKAQSDAYTISSAGTGTNNAVILNSWALSTVTLTPLPVFDFNSNYDAINFTPGATTGYNITITAGAAIFTSALVGGAFEGNGGICRIITFTSTTVIRVNIVQAFVSTAAIPGTQVFLAEPAWSDDRGWPSKCSSYQSRAVFANSRSLPNGLWLSVVNDYNNFDGLEDDADNAISWYPSSDNVNFIKFIVPYRSLTIHTNTGVYSTPLSFEQAVAKSTFSMTLQESTPSTSVQPRAIDNQIIVISGNDVHSMLWDGFNNAYTSNIASIANEHLVRQPIDEAVYRDNNRAGSRYVFIVNEDGSMVLFQTLISEDVAGFSPTTLHQSYGESYFRWVAGSSDGRAWFMTERQIASAGSTELIEGVTTDSIVTITLSLFEVGVITAFKLSTTSSLPTSSPQLEEDTYYWGIASDTTNVTVYTNIADAEAAESAVTFSSAGFGTSITPWPLVTKFYLEELSFDVKTDCSYTYSGAAVTEFDNLPRFNAQNVKINGNGFGFDAEGNNDTVLIEAHGQPVDVTSGYVGFSIPTVMEPLVVSTPGTLGWKSSNLTFPEHIRYANLMFNDTVGGFVNGEPIQLQTLATTIPGDPPPPASGVMEISPMLGWNDDAGGIVITHDEPFDIRLLGIFYRLES